MNYNNLIKFKFCLSENKGRQFRFNFKFSKKKRKRIRFWELFQIKTIIPQYLSCLVSTVKV